MSKNGKTVHDTTAALLGPSHVDDLTDAVTSLTRVIRRLDDTMREALGAHVDALRFQTKAVNELADLMRGAKPESQLSPDTEHDL